ncbi:trk system potassium uptake protein TrkA [bacterium BMS3Abin05]|nr:trk system potassium uptake protein TrkA [bacterium BMS3Abin05]GBE28463.1 trk system potassium uptake protein TrkA [bacterium BMS3Bbin03]
MRTIIIGAGRVGSHLAKILSSENHDVVVIDPSPEICDWMEEHMDIMAIQGYGTDINLLKQAKIDQADMLLAVSNSDEVNLVACEMAQMYGVPHKIARVRNSHFYTDPPQLSVDKFHVDIVIHPEEETAQEVVRLIKRSTASEVYDFANGHVQLVGIRLDMHSPLSGKNLIEIARENPELKFRIVAIFRNNRTIIPSGKDYLVRRDEVFFIAKTEEISKIVTLAGKAEAKIEKVMILGGGKMGRSVARLLEKEKDIEIKLIESNPEKTQVVAEQLEQTLVIQGDGRDIDLLGSEGIMEMDAFIALTSDEETNLLTALLAKHLGVKRTIVLINQENYLPIMAPIGIDAAVNTNLVTSNVILRFIRRGDVVSVTSIPGLDAEVLEFLAHKSSRIIGSPLKKVKIPQGSIVGAVTRGEEVIIPTGDTMIEPEDKVIIFALPEAIAAVEKMF